MNHRQGFMNDPSFKAQIVRKATEDPNKFSQGYLQSNQADYIPGESDRDRRLRLRALERNSRLGSAKSNISAYQAPNQVEPANQYQENLKFPENAKIETSFVKAAQRKDLLNESDLYQNQRIEKSDMFRQNFGQSSKQESQSHQRHDVSSSAETLKPQNQDTSYQSTEAEIGIYPGFENPNDRFRQKQANLKKEMQQDFKNFMHQNQHFESKKERIQQKREESEEYGNYFPSEQQNQELSQKRKQIADEVFNEILSSKGNKESIPSKIGYNQRPVDESHNPQNNFLFKGSEEEQLRQERMKKLEYGEILRSQIGSSKSKRPESDGNENYQFIENNLRGDQPRINKDEYRLELERQIQEKKERENREKTKIKEEDIQYQRNITQNIQQPGIVNEQILAKQRPVTSNQPNQNYYRQQSITNQREETPEQVAEKLRYQAELRQQIEEKEKRDKEEKQRMKMDDEYQELKKQQEQKEMITQYNREENIQMPDTQGRPFDFNNRKKYFEPSSNNPITSHSIKRQVEQSNPIQNPHNIRNEGQFQSNQQNFPESSQINPSSVRPQENEFRGQDQFVGNAGFNKPPIQQRQVPQEVQPQVNMSNPQMSMNQQMSTNHPQMNMNQPQMNTNQPQMNMNQPQGYNGQAFMQNQEQINSMIESQKKMIEMYQNTLQQVLDLQSAIKDTHGTIATQAQQKNYSPTPIKPKREMKPMSPKAEYYMNEAEKSNKVLSSQLTSLYGELGTMLAKKHGEIQNQSHFVKQPDQSIPNEPIDKSNYLQASTYKFDQSLNQSMNQSLKGKSKFVRVPDEDLQPQNLEESRFLSELAETWKSNQFDGNFDREEAKLQSSQKEQKRPEKFTNYSAKTPQEEDAIQEDLKAETLDKEEIERAQRIKDLTKQYNEQEEKWKKHQEALDAKDLLQNAMKDAELFMKNDLKQQEMDKLATESHQQKQLDHVSYLNQGMDEIEEMIQNQHESNIKRKPMENSLSSLKSSMKDSVHESQKDAFDKLEEVAKSVDQEELRKTSKSSKSKRKPWGATKEVVESRTDYNKIEKEEEEVNHKINDSPIKKSTNEEENLDRNIKSKEVKMRQSERYDNKFDNTEEQKIFENPEPKDENSEDDYNLAYESVHGSASAFSPDNLMNRKQAKTQENFHQPYMTGFGDGNMLNNEIWQKNFEALKTNYLKMMTQNNAKNKKPEDYRFNDSLDDTLSKQVNPHSEKKSVITHHAVTENEYEKFRKTFKDNENQNNPEVEQTPEEMRGTLDVKEVIMEQPKYGNVNKSNENVDAQFIRTNSGNKSIDIEEQTFNWDDEQRKSASKINIAQEDEDYEDDFEEEEVKEQHETPQKAEIKSILKNSTAKKSEKNLQGFTVEEEHIIDHYEMTEDKDKMNTMQKQGENLKNESLKLAPSYGSTNSNKINEYLTRKNQEGTFNVEEIIASRQKKQEKSISKVSKRKVIDPLKKIPKSPNNLLKSYKQARKEKQESNLKKQLNDKIEKYESSTIDKLENLINMYEIGESMPIEDDLQKKQQEPSKQENISENIIQRKESEMVEVDSQQKKESPKESNGDTDFERSLGLEDDKNNPFIINNSLDYWEENKYLGKKLPSESIQPKIKKKNQISYGNSGQEKKGKVPIAKSYQLPVDEEDEENIEFPAYMKANNPFENESILKRPLSGKHSERYSKC